jgi:hypothetical protein
LFLLELLACIELCLPAAVVGASVIGDAAADVLPESVLTAVETAAGKAASSLIIYSGVQPLLNLVTGRPPLEGMDPLDLTIAAMVGAATGPLGGLSMLPIKFMAGGVAQGWGDVLSQKAHGTNSVPEFVCNYVSGGVQASLPEAKGAAQAIMDTGFALIGYSCNMMK